MNDGRVHLTVLNSMAGTELEACFDTHVRWGLAHLDLKDGLFGKGIEALTATEAEQVKAAAEHRGLRVHTLSSCLFGGDIEQGEAAFRAEYQPALANLLEVARLLSPRQLRLLMARSSRRAEFLDASAYAGAKHPWLVGLYREAVDQIAEAGFQVVIENEVGGCLFTRPTEILEFFAELNRGEVAGFTWDVQNLWQMGTFPSLEVYRLLKPLVRMIHLKGGRSEIAGGPLRWASQLEDASWPVLAIVREVIRDGRSPVICLNPSHGQASSGFRLEVVQDLDFLRRNVEAIL